MRAAAILTAALLVFGFFVPSKPDVHDPERAEAYILIEAVTGTVLEGKNIGKRLNCGYLCKLMTVLLIAEDIETGRYTMETEVTAGQSVSGTKGAVVWLEPGDKMTVEELLKSVIIGNANDAVTALAEKSEGTIEDFVMRMNSEAFDLGLRDTAFYSPWGYYDEREYTTARDMAVICSQLVRYDFLRPIFCTWRDFVKEGRTELVSENTLTRTYDRHAGFKACHSEQTGYCSAEAGVNERGDCYISVILGAPDEDCSLTGAKRLINRGFSGHRITATMFPDEMLRPLKVVGGTDKAVEIRLRAQSRIVVPKGVSELSTVVVLPEYITAPVVPGQRIGKAAFYSGKELVCESDIITSGAVDKLTLGYVVKKTLLRLLK